jgi:hypothetical protein
MMWQKGEGLVNFDCSKYKTNFSRLKLFRKIATKVDVMKLSEFLDTLSADLWDPSTQQICFTHTPLDYPSKPRFHHEGCGSLTYQWSFEPYGDQGRLNEREVKLHEAQFTEFNEEFAGTYIDEIYQQVRSEFPVRRMRLMKLKPKKCLSYHTDNDLRIHYAIHTDPACQMVIDSEVAHMPADGNGYLCNTRLFHTAFNGTHKLQRIHLVFGVLGDFEELCRDRDI